MARARGPLVAIGAAALLALGAIAHAPRPGQPRCVVSALSRLSRRNRLKLRDADPRAADVDTAVTLAAILAPGDDRRRFDERRAADVEGVVVRVVAAGPESVNCFARDPLLSDTHIELAAAPSAPETARVVVEVTPGWRAAMRARGVDWSSDALRAALVGRRVRVRGWLLFDSRHADGAARTDPTDRRGERNWRATAWEIHPITGLTVPP